MGFGFFGDLLPFELAYGEAFIVEDGEAVGLRLAEQGAGFGQGVVYRKVKERRFHEVAGGFASQALVFVEVAVFFGRGDDDESADEDEAPVTDFKPDEDEAQAGQLPDAGGYACGAQARRAEVEQGAEDASAIHGEGREQVEEGEHDVEDEQGGRPVAQYGGEPVFHFGGLAEKGVGDAVKFWREEVPDRHSQQGHDDDIDQRAGDGDGQFVSGFGGQALQACDASDGREQNVLRAYAVMARHECMAVFVHDYAGKERADEKSIPEHQNPGKTFLCPAQGKSRRQQETEGPVQTQRDASKARYLQGCFHLRMFCLIKKRLKPESVFADVLILFYLWGKQKYEISLVLYRAVLF